MFEVALPNGCAQTPGPNYNYPNTNHSPKPTQAEPTNIKPSDPQPLPPSNDPAKPKEHALFLPLGAFPEAPRALAEEQGTEILNMRRPLRACGTGCRLINNPAGAPPTCDNRTGPCAVASPSSTGKCPDLPDSLASEASSNSSMCLPVADWPSW